MLQASQFGSHCVTADPYLPSAFLDGEAILITSVQKLFNGITKFGLGAQSLAIGTIVMDDSHACLDAIRDACAIRLPYNHQCYRDLLNLFGPELEKRGVGTYADIRQHKPLLGLGRSPHGCRTYPREIQFRGRSEVRVADSERRVARLPLRNLGQILRNRTVHRAALPVRFVRQGQASDFHVGHRHE